MSTTLSTLETQIRRHLIEPASLATPGAITVGNAGTPGATTWTYKLVAINGNGNTEAGAASSTTTGNATLNGTNYNTLSWTAVPNATGYWIYRTAAGGTPTTTGRIAALGAVTTYNDQGAAGDATTAPTSNGTVLSSPFWSSAEIVDIINKGAKDLWRDIVDLKQEHFLTIDNTNVSYAPSSRTLTGVPSDVHKIYLIEARDITENGANTGLQFLPLDYNHHDFQLARSRDAIDPKNDTIYYSVAGAGAPVGAPTIYVAPYVSSTVTISFGYVPILSNLAAGDANPIPGESDQALIAWGVAFARAKERDDRSPDENWLAIYATEKQHLLSSLGLRQYQEPIYAEAEFAEYW